MEVAQNADGSGWRMPSMTSQNLSDAWHQAAVVAMSSTTFTLRTGPWLAYFRALNASGNMQAYREQSGFCRVQLFDWQPDYDSGWTYITNGLGKRDKWFRHGLGQMPRVTMVYLSENADGSGWVLPAMGGYRYGYNRGTGLYSLTDEWATVTGGAGYLGQFYPASGTTVVNSDKGYVRFMAWK